MVCGLCGHGASSVKPRLCRASGRGMAGMIAMRTVRSTVSVSPEPVHLVISGPRPSIDFFFPCIALVGDRDVIASLRLCIPAYATGVSTGSGLYDGGQ
ncbi:Hypothetical protein GbCGDNIH2_5050 [Granulibacter bethesdensis]|nr:Hypothetical protein GbCGDNIH2_5050 [Granulibacter bethesdensis]